MCGIAGIIETSRENSNFLDDINKMLCVLSHRGPDAKGYEILQDKNLCFGHTRLSILDLSQTGSQPMWSKCKNYLITFNGEIYNHLSIKKKIDKLNKYNFKWRGTSDTEVLLEAFSAFGFEETINLIKGMYAFVIFDKRLNKIFLVRDRMGEKPLYFSKISGKLLFASELNAIKRIVSKDNLSINEEAKNFYINFGHISETHTIFNEIKKLKPGEYISFDLHNLNYERVQYWNSKNFTSKRKNTYPESKIISETHELLLKSVQSQMVSDVPLGAFLSGGVDSSLVVALMQSISDKKIKTFSIGSSSKKYDESVYAQKVANHIGTEHHTLIVTPSDVIKSLESSTNIFDEPFSDSSSVVTRMVCDYARQFVTVALTGDGADEIFGGYNRHRLMISLWPKIKNLPHPLKKLIKIILESTSSKNMERVGSVLGLDKRWADLALKVQKSSLALNAKNIEELYNSLLNGWPMKNNKLDITEYIDKLDNIESDFEKFIHWDVKSYLPSDILTKVDRASMSVSLETRAPFLDKDLVEYALSLDSKYKIRKSSKGLWENKWILRQILSDYVPRVLTDRPKMGFGFPLDDWLRGPLKEWTMSLLSTEEIEKSGFNNKNQLKIYVEEHMSGKRNWHYQIWTALVFQQWWKNYEANK